MPKPASNTVISDNHKSEKVALLDTIKKPSARRNVFTAVAGKFAAFFARDYKGEIRVASTANARRPVVNEMVARGLYSPDHNHLNQVEQGSSTIDYNYDWTPIKEIKHQLLKESEILDKIEVGVDLPIMAVEQRVEAPALLSQAMLRPVHEGSGENIIMPQGLNLQKQLSISLDELLNTSKSLIGINIESKLNEKEVVIPEISDLDLKAPSSSKPMLSRIPLVPKEFT
jgi:hypothetical protein